MGWNLGNFRMGEDIAAVNFRMGVEFVVVSFRMGEGFLWHHCFAAECVN